MKVNSKAVKQLIKEHWKDLISDHFRVQECLSTYYFDRDCFVSLYDFHEDYGSTEEEYEAEEKGTISWDERLKLSDDRQDKYVKLYKEALRGELTILRKEYTDSMKRMKETFFSRVIFYESKR